MCMPTGPGMLGLTGPAIEPDLFFLFFSAFFAIFLVEPLDSFSPSYPAYISDTSCMLQGPIVVGTYLFDSSDLTTCNPFCEIQPLDHRI